MAKTVAGPEVAVTEVLAVFGSSMVTVPLVAVQFLNKYPEGVVTDMSWATPWVTVTGEGGEKVADEAPGGLATSVS